MSSHPTMPTSRPSPAFPVPSVAVTRPEEEGEGEDRLAYFLRSEGMNPVSFPILAVVPPRSRRELDAAAERIVDALRRGEGPPYSWIVVTSRNVIGPFLEAIRNVGGRPEALQDAGVRVAAVGQATAAALADVGLPPDLVPSRYRAEDLLEALHEQGGVGGYGRILLPRADVARDVLPSGIRELGGEVDVVTAYRVAELRTGAEALCRAVRQGSLRGVTLTSGRAAHLLGRTWTASDGGSWPGTVLVGVLGPVTGDAAREAGLPVHTIPERSTLAALAKAMGRNLGVSE